MSTVYVLPIRNWFSSTPCKRRINSDKWSHKTTSSGSEFQILSTRTAKKCCLQFTPESGKKQFKWITTKREKPVGWQQNQTSDNLLTKKLNLHIFDEAPGDRVQVKHNAHHTIATEIPAASQPLDREAYQIMLLDDRGARVWTTTRSRLLPEREKAGNWTRENSALTTTPSGHTWWGVGRGKLQVICQQVNRRHLGINLL